MTRDGQTGVRGLRSLGNWKGELTAPTQPSYGSSRTKRRRRRPWWPRLGMRLGRSRWRLRWRGRSWEVLACDAGCLPGWEGSQGEVGAGCTGAVVEEVTLCRLRWGGDGGVWGGGGGGLGCGEGEEGRDCEKGGEEVHFFCLVLGAFVFFFSSFLCSKQGLRKRHLLRGSRDVLTPIPSPQLPRCLHHAQDASSAPIRGVPWRQGRTLVAWRRRPMATAGCRVWISDDSDAGAERRNRVRQ